MPWYVHVLPLSQDFITVMTLLPSTNAVYAPIREPSASLFARGYVPSLEQGGLGICGINAAVFTYAKTTGSARRVCGRAELSD